MDHRDEYDRGRRYRGEGYYGGYYDSPKRDREHREWERGGAQRRESDRPRGDDRGFFERAGDEVRSWFGDEDAERRRMRDERDERRGWGESARGWTAREDHDVDRDWARQWGYVEGRGRGSEQQPWQYRDRGYREPQSSSPSQRYVGSSWTRESGYGREGWGDPSGWGPETGWPRSSGDVRQGPHAGRGPRGYTRSDERIREDICDRLAEHGFVDASDIEVRVNGGEVTLQGSVHERHEKRIAEDLAERVSGVQQVRNELRVDREGTRREGDEQSGRGFRAA
jgi:osmotically-inducible protein OsmY